MGSNICRPTLLDQSWLSCKKAAEYLGVTPNALRIKVHRGHVKFYRLGKSLRFKKEDLDNLISIGDEKHDYQEIH